MDAPSVDLTHVSLTAKTVAVIVALILAVGLLLMMLWPTVSGAGQAVGNKLRRTAGQATANASPRTQSASSGLM